MMQITVKAAIGAQVINHQIKVEEADRVKSIIIAFLEKNDTEFKKEQHLRLKNDSGKVLHRDDRICDSSIYNGDTVYLSHLDTDAGWTVEYDGIPSSGVKSSSSRSRNINTALVIIGVLLVSGGITGIIALTLKYTDELCSDEGYGAVFDAGSTHTNMTVYNWPGDEEIDGTGIVKQRGTCRAQGGGISSYADNPQDAGPSLQDCLDDAKHDISSNYYSYTSLSLGATAGMRLLDITQPATSDAIMNSVQITMAASPFNFTDDQARIISGYDEGVFGWISVNFISRTLNVGSMIWKVFSAVLPTQDTPPTYGALDLGGASTQITFAPKEPITMPAEYSASLRLYGVDHTLYTHSYLCFGINEAIRRYKANLVVASEYMETTDNPCAPVGFSETLAAEYLWKPPCSVRNDTDTEGQEDTPTSFILNGTSNETACSEAVKELFNFGATCQYPTCSFNGTYQPKVNGKFVAMSTFANVIQSVGLPPTVSINTLKGKTASFCKKTYNDIKNMTGDIQYLVLYCFELNFISTLLLDGYKFDEDTWQITFTPEVNGQELGWSLGFMINATNMLPTEALCTSFSTTGFYVGISILIACVVIGIILLVIGIYKCAHMNKQNLYTELNQRAEMRYGAT